MTNDEMRDFIEHSPIRVYKKHYFVQAENTFIRNEKYEMAEKMVYLCLASFAGNESACYPSKETIAKACKTSVKTVERTLKSLKDMGAVIIVNQITETNRKTSNFYILADIDKDTGDFIPDSIIQYKYLTEKPRRTTGK